MSQRLSRPMSQWLCDLQEGEKGTNAQIGTLSFLRTFVYILAEKAANLFFSHVQSFFNLKRERKFQRTGSQSKTFVPQTQRRLRKLAESSLVRCSRACRLPRLTQSAEANLVTFEGALSLWCRALRTGTPCADRTGCDAAGIFIERELSADFGCVKS